MQERDVLSLLREIDRYIDQDVSLDALAARVGLSRFHVQRAFLRFAGETPKQHTQRLRLTRAAARLINTRTSVLGIALDAGFASHEVFTRAFRRQFGRTPTEYRDTVCVSRSNAERTRQIALADAVAPCLHLFHFSLRRRPRRLSMPVISISREERPAQPVLLIRRRIARAELQPTLAECFGTLYGHAQKEGLAIAGFPLARYVATGPGLWTIEPAIPLAVPAPGTGEIEAGWLPGGPFAVGIHAGPYEDLAETNAAIERWIDASGYRPGGPPWEWYVTDPAQHPDPAVWRTEVYWPLAE